MSATKIEIIGVSKIPVVKANDDIAELILEATEKEKIPIENGDIIVIAHTIISKAEKRVIDRNCVRITPRARKIAAANGFDPVHVELAIQESQTILRTMGVLIVKTRNGMICNFAGVDRSNAPPHSFILLPKNPDASAQQIREKIKDKTRKQVAVIISDTQGRPWRRGGVNIAIGCAGINAFRYEKGRKDRFGRTLQRSTICQVDEIAAAAEPIMGQADEATPVVIVKGYQFRNGPDCCEDINRSSDEDLFN